MKKIFNFLLILIIFSCSNLETKKEDFINIKFEMNEKIFFDEVYVFSTKDSIRIYLEKNEEMLILNDGCEIDFKKCIIGKSPLNLEKDVYFENGKALIFIYKEDKENLTFPLNLKFNIKKNNEIKIIKFKILGDN